MRPTPTSMLPRLLVMLFGLAVAQSAIAQALGYTRLNVKGRVQIDIPSDWTINDAEHRKRVKEFAEKTFADSGATFHAAALSAASYPQPSRAFVRVSVLAQDPELSQAELNQEVRANRAGILKDLALTWRTEERALWDALAKVGQKKVGESAFAIESLGGKTALIVRYGRTSAANSSETMRVAQFHIPLGREKVVVTFSNIESDSGAKAVIERIRQSIRIQ